MPRASVPAKTLGSAWVQPRRRAVRTGDSLTREQVVEAAVTLVDRGGLGDLSMRRVAAELDVGVTTLYWHVADKEQLLDLICDAVLGEIQQPAVSNVDWATQLVHLMSELRRVLLRHRDLATLLPTRDNVGPNALRVREFVAAALMQAGLPAHCLAWADHSLLSYVLGFVAAEVGAAAAAQDRGADVVTTISEEVRFLAALPPEEFPGLAQMASSSGAHDRDASFAFGLKLLVAGIEAQVPAPRKARASARRRRPT